MPSRLTAEIMRKEAIMIMANMTGRDWREFDGQLTVVLADQIDSRVTEIAVRRDGRQAWKEVSTQDLCLSINEFATRHLMPLVSQILPWCADMGLWAQFADAA